MKRNTYEEVKNIWKKAMTKKGHTPQLDEDGEIDLFAYSPDGHNGPRCTTCKWSCCRHCESVENIPKCTGKKEY